MSRETRDLKIDEYFVRSKGLNGQAISEREQWNTCASADAIRHFAYGISDDNPLWIDHAYARRTRYGRLAAPPSFLTSVLYPGLHGFPMAVPLSSLLSELSFEWYRPILEGSILRASARQLDVRKSRNRQGRRLVYVLSETTYSNGRGEIVGKANSTMARMQQVGSDLLVDRGIYQYSDEELRKIKNALRSEPRTGGKILPTANLQAGFKLPVLVRGPLTIGDLIAWQSAIGPSYRAAALGFKDGEKDPHTTAIHPVTGWPYKLSQQHEDGLLSKQRGMPAPFDNTVMRFAWVSSMLTNWIGNDGFLRSLNINAIEPVLYGDTNWYRGEVIASNETDLHRLVTVKVTGTNQIDQITTDGFAEISTPLHPGRGRQNFAAPQTLKANTQETVTFCSEFALRAQKYAKKQAVVCGATSLSYGALDERSTLLCKHLKEKKIEPGNRVGVLLGRSVDAIVAPVAVIKAGATYVPLDSDYPEQTLLGIIEEARVDVFLTHSALRERLTACEAPIVCLDRSWDTGIKVTDHERETTVDRSDIAYIMFTSGTTGDPKAVAVTYGSLNLYLASMSAALEIGHEDVYLNTAGFSFSASTRQSFLPLYCGCRMVLADEEQRRNQHALLTLIKQEQVTVWDTVPTSLHLCIDYLRDTDAKNRSALLANSVRLILATGEALPWDIPNAWFKEFGHAAQMVNLYSQTETSGTVCIFKIPRNFKDENGIVPLGKPTKDSTVYILDKAMNPVPGGGTGELYVGGDRVALGYVNDPRLSAETFICDPFKSDVNARLYKTGDLVYELPDGNLQTRGRADTRVNIDGYRIELTAIETLLDTCGELKKAVVVVSRGPSYPRHLVGYVVPKVFDKNPTRRLRTFLKDKLPVFMLPTVFVQMEKLPVTDSGKVDRNFLSSLGGFEKPIHADVPDAPDSKAEQELLLIWKRVMELQSLGVNDDFFELGGHSLHATQICSQIYDNFGERIKLTDIFVFPTVRELAAYMESR